MVENQNIEWKESWRDEYLKWICGFANAQGGKIYIGTDDNGNVIGVPDSKKLLEDIPNKARDILGIIVDVNLLTQDGKDYIEICVNPSSYPVNYKGEYHYRSGSTKQLLRGAALTEFLLSKTGYKWDAVPVDDVTVEDLDKESFDIFRREALRSGRMTEKDLNMSNEQLLDSLGLLEHGKLKRAVILLFHRNPEKWVTGAYIKIGYFGEGSDLRYQDEIHGSLFIQADRVIELIYLKYMKAIISYDNVTRIETYPLPKAAVREAVYNAIIHSNYAALVPIQIRIHEDAVYISNDCVFPVGWTVETLMERHPIPEYTLHLEDIMVKFTPLGQQNVLKDHNVLINDRLNVLLDVSLEETVLSAMRENSHITQAQLSKKLNRSDRQIRRVIKELREKGIIERIGSRKSGKWVVK